MIETIEIKLCFFVLYSSQNNLNNCMLINDRILLYKIIAIVCTVVLCIVQLAHIRNIYALENQVFNKDEKKLIKASYDESIINDKVYPGGQKIIDSIVFNNFDSLEYYAAFNPEKFKALSIKVCDTLFTTLQKKSNFETLFDTIKKKNNIGTDMVYALFIDELAIAPKANQYHTVFNKNDHINKYSFPFVKNTGAKIGGTLDTYTPQTLTSTLGISSPAARSYRLRFTLYSDRPDRLNTIVWRTMPQTLLSVFCIIAVVGIFFYTFSNWIKQKKESEMKSDFINTITHEFQTPLTAIIIANKTIEHENETIKSEKLVSLNNIISRQTERLNVLMKEVIETSGQKPIKLVMEKYSINQLLAEIISDYQINFENANANVMLVNRAANDIVLLDKLHFTSIILNVLDNGIKYNQKENKEIIVTTGFKSSNVILVSIKDNGDGMTNNVKKKIFSKFYRNPSLNNVSEPGIGLGLYYTKQCLDAHNWEYEVMSKEQVGTEFIIYIPLVKDHYVQPLLDPSIKFNSTHYKTEL
jgi:two-component system, OmpR family, phosphate regulon sensor histidine kinase PhoR